MHFALPPRKSSNPPPYARSPRWNASPDYKKQQMRLGAAAFCAILLVFYFLLRIFSTPSGAPERIPPGTPEVIIVTPLDDSLSETFVARIKENREDYAARHGYKTFYPSPKDYDLGGAPKSWTLVPGLRHAMTLHPHATYFFHLAAPSLIMNPALALPAHVMAPPRLEQLMLKDKPVVPPDSVIHTFSHLRGDKIDLVLTQDGEGLCQESFVLRRGEWAQFFLDVWFDPLYRSYNFQKAEGHALEHIVQWHPTILTKLALVKPRVINSYTAEIATRGGKAVTFQEDDFVARAVGCEKDAQRSCEDELSLWYDKWKKQWGQRA